MAEPANWVASVRHFLESPLRPEQCELCSKPLIDDHPHLVEPGSQRLLCACESCALLFDHGDGRYQRVPRRVRRLDDFDLSETLWDILGIPIELAFFYRRSSDGRVVALYPGPAGTTESLLELDAWESLRAANPVLDDFQPDVEAILINRANGARDYYRVPIDRCYELAGLMRRHWRGLSGGTEVWKVIGDYFTWLRGEPGGWRHA